MKNKMILIAGRSGSGKDTFAGMLANLGLKGVKSYATRKKRFDDEDTHIFISKEEAEEIANKVATTKIGEYEYFATKSQLEEADYYIIDPCGIAELTANCPDIDFKIYYIYANYYTRRERALHRSSDSNELDIFEKRNSAEDKQFTLFEQMFSSFIYDSVTIIKNEEPDAYKILQNEAEMIADSLKKVDATDEISSQEYYLLSKLTRKLKVDDEFDIAYDGRESFFVDREDGGRKSLKWGFELLSEAISYSFQQEGFSDYEANILEKLIQRYVPDFKALEPSTD